MSHVCCGVIRASAQLYSDCGRTTSNPGWRLRATPRQSRLSTFPLLASLLLPSRAAVPAGFRTNSLPVDIAFLGRPCGDAESEIEIIHSRFAEFFVGESPPPLLLKYQFGYIAKTGYGSDVDQAQQHLVAQERKPMESWWYIACRLD